MFVLQLITLFQFILKALICSFLNAELFGYHGRNELELIIRC